MKIKKIENLKEALPKLWEYDLNHQKINFPKDCPNYEEFKKNTLKEYEEEPEGFFFVYDDEKIIGFLKLKTMFNPFRRQKYGELRCIHLDPSGRGKGYGKKLMDYSDHYFKSNGCKYALLGTSVFNKSSRGLFKKAGYLDTRVIMEKDY